jgi:hypothetical protein
VSRYTDDYGPNVSKILSGATRVVRGRVPAEVRKELMDAVKAGILGRLKKDGLKPEIFFHPDHYHGAVERQKREAEYSVRQISQVLLGPTEFRDIMDREEKEAQTGE